MPASSVVGKEEGTGDCRKHDKSVIFIALEEEEEEWAEGKGRVCVCVCGGGSGAHRIEEAQGFRVEGGGEAGLGF